MSRFLLYTLACATIMAFSCASVPDDSVKESRKRPSHKAMEVSQSDVEAEIQFGQELSARILGRYRLYDDEKATKYINLIGKGLAAYSERPEIEFRFAILNTDIINAFAAPGGYIFVTKGTLQMIEDEAQLAGVLAHEIAHVTEKHIVNELNIQGGDDSPLSGFASLLGGGGSEAIRIALTQMVDKATEVLFEKGLKKEDELASDRLAVMLVSNAGYDPVSYKELLERINEKGAGKENTKIVSSTHPPFNDRVESLGKFLAEEGLNELNYAKAKERFSEYVNF